MDVNTESNSRRDKQHKSARTGLPDARGKRQGMNVSNQKQLAVLLMCMGAVPFIILSSLTVVAEASQFLPATPALILHIYAVIIASFVAGLHWGIHFCKRTSDSVYIHSSLIAMLLWLSMLAAGTATGLALVLFGFIFLWIIEYRFSLQRATTAWFWRVRSTVTAVVSGCLLVAILFA